MFKIDVSSVKGEPRVQSRDLKDDDIVARGALARIDFQREILTFMTSHSRRSVIISKEQASSALSLSKRMVTRTEPDSKVLFTKVKTSAQDQSMVFSTISVGGFALIHECSNDFTEAQQCPWQSFDFQM